MLAGQHYEQRLDLQTLADHGGVRNLSAEDQPADARVGLGGPDDVHQPGSGLFLGGAAATAAWVAVASCAATASNTAAMNTSLSAKLVEIAGRQAGLLADTPDGEFGGSTLLPSSSRPIPAGAPGAAPAGQRHPHRHTAVSGSPRHLDIRATLAQYRETPRFQIAARGLVVSNTASVSVVDRPVSDSAGPAANRSLFQRLTRPALFEDGIPGSRCWPDRRT